MAKLKMLKMPKRPKAHATVQVKERWLKKAAETKKENGRRASVNKKSELLSKKIANFK